MTITKNFPFEDRGSFAERLISRHLSGDVSLGELLDCEIDAGHVAFLRMRCIRPTTSSSLTDRLDDLCSALRELSLSRGGTQDRYAKHREHVIETEVIQMYETLLATGGCFSRATLPLASRRLKPDALGRRINDRSIIAIGHLDAPRFPAIQFLPDGHVAHGIDRVADALQEREPAFIFNFLTTPSVDLGGVEPMVLLKASHLDPVLRAASTSVFI
jgi:hypothetical protein